MRASAALLLCTVCLLSGCGNEHTVAGPFRLEQWEDGKKYYLHKQGYDDSHEGGSILGGITLRLGWNSRFIVAKRYSFYRGDPDGWMIIDIKSSLIRGPYTDEELRLHLEVQDITTYEVNEAWKKL